MTPARVCLCVCFALSALLAGATAKWHAPRVQANGPERIGDVDLWLKRPPSHQGLAQPLASEGFVYRSGKQLHLQNKPWYYVGFNAYWLIDKCSWDGDWGRRVSAELLVAAKRIDLRVARTWAFNSALPQKDGAYSERQFEALDFIIYAAGRYNVRVLLALGNLWPAYFPPERWLLQAKGISNTDGLDIMDFYRDQSAKQMYKKHISTIVNRVNTFTGVKYKDDPAIFGWDVLNEPRCPECPQDIPHAWMDSMTKHLRHEDPNHLVLMGTEGFFMPGPDNLHQFNPGSGAQCEGEDWPSIGNLAALDVTTVHIYERHMEKRPLVPQGRSYLRNPDWSWCGFHCYINWLVPYIQLHLEVNQRDNGKPLIIEEFGLTWWRSDVADMKVLVEVMRQMLVNSARTNGALAGVMFWSAAHNESADQDGYNVRIDRWPKSVPHTPVTIKYPIVPPVLGSYKPLMTKYDKAGADKEFLKRQVPVRSSSKEEGKKEGKQEHKEEGKQEGKDGGRRSLNFQQDVLDGFRRGWQRGDCAHTASKTWRPMPIDYSIVDVDKFRSFTASYDVVDILAKTTRQLRDVRAG